MVAAAVAAAVPSFSSRGQHVSKRSSLKGGVHEYPLTRPVSYPPPSAPPPLGPPPPPHCVQMAPPSSLGSVGINSSSSSNLRRPHSYHHAHTETAALGRALTASARRLEAAPSDKEKVRTTTRVLSMAARYLGRKLSSIDLSGPLSLFGDDKGPGIRAAWGDEDGGLGAAVAPSPRHQQQLLYQQQQQALANFGTIRPVPRQHLSYHVRRRENGAWQATVSLVQPFVHGQWTDPQGTRPGHITLGFFRTEEGALAACRNHAPPVWAEPVKGAACYLCHTGAKALFKSPCHCRNCGQLVCAKCSRSRWPNGMLPPTYHNNESRVRVCDACNHLALHFRRALKDGDVARARELFASGNVNAWSPFVIEGTKEYPVHLAAEGGSLELLRWLVDDLGCPLYDEDDQPLRTQPRGDSVLGVASRQRHAHVMRWLVAAKECKVGEIADRAQLVAAVEFLLLGGESGASSGSGSGGSGGGAYALPPPSSSRRSRRRMLEDEEGEEEVKQQEVVSDYGSGEDEDDPEDLEVIRQLRKGHGLSTRPATATAAGRLGKGKQQRQQQRQRQRGEEAPPEGARCVDDCLLCGDHAVDSLILPCGHICVCSGCGQGCRSCPACRTRVKRVVRLEA